MTHDLGNRLENQLDDIAPPLGLTADALATKGRRSVRARRYGIGGGVTAAVAVLAAGALILPTAFGNGGAGTGTSSNDTGNAAEQPAVTLPPIDPNETYMWDRWKNGNPTTNGDTDTLSQALWNQVGDLHLMAYPHDESGAVPVTAENFAQVAGFQRVEETLMRVTPDSATGPYESTGYKQAVYETPDGVDFQVPAGEHYQESLDVKISPNGGFLPDAGMPNGRPSSGYAPYLVAGCDEVDYSSQGKAAKTTFDCDESTTPLGEKVLTVERTEVKDGRTLERTTTVVLYRTDGTAVTVTAGLAFSGDETGVPLDMLDGKTHAVTPAEMLGFAQALPSVPVE